MKKRNPLAVLVLSIITFGIYDLYWLVKTKQELNRRTQVHVPTIWLLFAPLLIFLGLTALSIGTALLGSAARYSSGRGFLLGAGIIIELVYILAILAAIPISFYWFLKFSKAIDQYTNGKMGTGVTFLLVWALHLIGVAVIQDTFNDMLDAGTVPGASSANPTSTLGYGQPSAYGPTGSVTGAMPQQSGHDNASSSRPTFGV